MGVLASGCSEETERTEPRPQTVGERGSLEIGFNDDFIGSVHGFTPEQKLRLVENAGGTLIRTSLDWRPLEPARDQWDETAWEAAKELYELARGRGMQPILIIGFAPDWAREAGRCGPGSGPGLGACELPPRPDMDAEWAEYAAEVARRFPDAIIEVWNEPNFRAFWRSGADPERYARLFVRAATAIEEVAPDTPVLLAGLLEASGAPARTMPIDVFLRRVFAAAPEIAKLADGLNVHPYPRGTRLGAGSPFDRGLAQARTARDEAGASELPLYLTEVGISTGGARAVTPARQTEAMTRVLDRARAMPDVRALLFHRLFSPGETTANPWELGASWLLPGAYPPPPRPVYCAFVASAGSAYPGCDRNDLAPARAGAG